jgi:hypothetical protein
MATEAAAPAPVLSAEDEARRAERKRKLESMFKWADEGRVTCLVRIIHIDVEKEDHTYDVAMPATHKECFDDLMRQSEFADGFLDVQRWLLTYSTIGMSQGLHADKVAEMERSTVLKFWEGLFHEVQHTGIYSRSAMMQYDGLYLFND